ncbi:hypothetical protein LSH36_956g00002, partial [Paralvinella palmiformis]
YYVVETGLMHYNLTCKWIPNTVTAEWSAQPPIKVIICPEPRNTTNGTIIQSSGLGINDTTLYRCPPGYYVVETGLMHYNLTCKWIPNTVTAEWSAQPPIKVIICPEPRNTTNGTIIQSSGLGINDTTLYRCPPGYYVVETGLMHYNLTCKWIPNTVTAEWSAQPPIKGLLNLNDIFIFYVSSIVTKVIICPEPRNTTNGTIIQSSGLGINDTTLYRCPPGYYVVETGLMHYNLTCKWIPNTVTAEWSAQPPIKAIDYQTGLLNSIVTKVIICPEPRNTTNGTIIQSSGLGINDTTLYRCPPGYYVVETGLMHYNLTCKWIPNTVTAEWSAQPPIKG